MSRQVIADSFKSLSLNCTYCLSGNVELSRKEQITEKLLYFAILGFSLVFRGPLFYFLSLFFILPLYNLFRCKKPMIAKLMF